MKGWISDGRLVQVASEQQLRLREHKWPVEIGDGFAHRSALRDAFEGGDRQMLPALEEPQGEA